MRNNRSVEHASLNIPAVLRRIAAALALSTSSFSESFRSFIKSTVGLSLAGLVVRYVGGGTAGTDADTDAGEAEGVGMPRALDSDKRRSSSADDFPPGSSAERDTDADDDEEEGVGRLSDS